MEGFCVQERKHFRHPQAEVGGGANIRLWITIAHRDSTQTSAVQALRYHRSRADSKQCLYTKCTCAHQGITPDLATMAMYTHGAIDASMIPYAQLYVYKQLQMPV